MSKKIKSVFNHCSASNFGDKEFIRKIHVDQNGWRDIGYHLIILNGYSTKADLDRGDYREEDDGRVVDGRALNWNGNIEANEQGAHAKGLNHESVGVCLIGNESFTLKQFRSALAINKTFQSIAPDVNIFGHYESPHANGKTCPNFGMDHFRKLLETNDFTNENIYKHMSRWVKKDEAKPTAQISTNSLIDKILEKTFKLEGGYVDHPNDRGGPTKYGITHKVLAQHLHVDSVTKEDVQALTWDVARTIYTKQYYRGPRIDRLHVEVQPIIFDGAVNHGARRGIKVLQQTINSSNVSEVDTDGIIGNQTIEATNKAIIELDKYFIDAIVMERLLLYKSIVQKNDTQWKFFNGWTNRIRTFLVNEDSKDTYDREVQLFKSTKGETA